MPTETSLVNAEAAGAVMKIWKATVSRPAPAMEITGVPEGQDQFVFNCVIDCGCCVYPHGTVGAVVEHNGDRRPVGGRIIVQHHRVAHGCDPNVRRRSGPILRRASLPDRSLTAEQSARRLRSMLRTSKSQHSR